MRSSSLKLQPSALCHDIGPPFPRTPSALAFIVFLQQRLLAKSERLSREIDGLSASGARDVVAVACTSINWESWERLVRACGAILSPENLHDEAWDLVGSLGAAIGPTDIQPTACSAVQLKPARQVLRGRVTALFFRFPLVPIPRLGLFHLPLGAVIEDHLQILVAHERRGVRFQFPDSA